MHVQRGIHPGVSGSSWLYEWLGIFIVIDKREDKSVACMQCMWQGASSTQRGLGNAHDPLMGTLCPSQTRMADQDSRGMQFVAEASATLSRRGRGQAEDVWLKSPLYPDYYLNTFHYQARHACTAQAPV